MRSPNRLGNQQVAAIGIVLLAALAAYPLAQSIVTESYGELFITLAFVVGAFFTILILREWRLGVVLFFVWVVFEDLMRKFLGNNMLVYLTKDIIIFAAYGSFLLALAQRKETMAKNPLRIPLLAFVTWVFIETLNPYLENYLVPVLGLRMSLLYVPLLYLGYGFFRKEENLRRFWLLMLGIAALTSLLGITQSIVGLDFLNPASAPNLRLYLVRYAPGSGAAVPRPTSTFVDAGRFAQYMMVMAFVGLGIVAYLYNSAASVKRSTRLLAWAGWAMILIGLFLSGQRAAILWITVSFAAIFFGWSVISGLSRTRTRSRLNFPVGWVLAAGLCVLFLAALASPERFRSTFSFYTETMDPSSQYTEFSSRPQQHFRLTAFAWEQSEWLGHGTGSASLGLQYVSPLLRDQEAYKFRDQVEGGYAAVLWEWGIIGLVLWLWWSLLLLKVMAQTVWKLRDTRFFWLASAITMCIFFILFPSFFMGWQIYQNYLTQSFIWFLIGMLFRLPHFLSDQPADALAGAPTGPRRWFRPPVWVGSSFRTARLR